METVRSEPSGHSPHVAFARFQGDLLGEHDVSDRKSADRHETQPFLQATSFVDLGHVHRSPGVDPVSLSAVASDDLKVTPPDELLSLRRRQPSSQEQQRPALRRPLGAVPDEENSRRSLAGAATWRQRSKAEHGKQAQLPADQPGEEDSLFRIRVERSDLGDLTWAGPDRGGKADLRQLVEPLFRLR
jgi:hypothetical protein